MPSLFRSLGSNVPHPRNYYQISKVDQQRKQEQMVAEVERLREAEKLVEKHLQNMKSSEKKEITFRVSKLITRPLALVCPISSG
jgi:hypothetical protein